MIRLLLGLPVAVIATGVLFIVMYGFVKPGEVRLEAPAEPPVISIFAKKKVDDTRTDTQIEIVDKAPPPPRYEPPRAGPSDRPVIVADRPALNVGEPGEGRFGTPSLLPVATLAPQFPGRCQASGTEGYAVVRFDVTANGQVVNAEVVERSHACFEQSALRAIRGWRYQPSVGGDGYIARGVTKRFSFELDEA